MAAVLAMFAGLPAIAQTFNTIDNFDDNDDEGWTRLTAGDIAEVDARWELGDDRYTLRSETAVSPGQSGQVISTLNNSTGASTIWLLTPEGTDYFGGAIFLPTVSDTSWQIQENSASSATP